jgi:hypothetical protein
MESAVKANGIAKETGVNKPFLVKDKGIDADTRITVQQALCKWYTLFSQGVDSLKANGWLFPGISEGDLLSSLQTDIELVPSILMDEFISKLVIQDKEQYILLVQALLTNISNCLFLKENEFSSVCNQIENTIQFIQDFFYQQFDMDSRLTKFCLHQFCECSKLKLEYWQMKLNHSPLIEVLQECLADKFISPENNITYRKISYIKYMMLEVESASTVISENYIRDVFIYNNFNSECFISYEIELIKTTIAALQTNQEAILSLQAEQSRITQLKVKPGISYDNRQASLKKQLTDWINEEMKQLELKNRRATDKDLLIDTESKIQTSLSVAKLAVLIRLMAVDKIIINKSVAPMLRTVTKLFTTLQKDEISFGSMETKYHAPDKATLNAVKNMMLKWVNILGKL